MSVFLERLSMWNLLNCAEHVQIQKFKTHACKTLKTLSNQPTNFPADSHKRTERKTTGLQRAVLQRTGTWQQDYRDTRKALVCQLICSSLWTLFVRIARYAISQNDWFGIVGRLDGSHLGGLAVRPASASRMGNLRIAARLPVKV